MDVAELQRLADAERKRREAVAEEGQKGAGRALRHAVLATCVRGVSLAQDLLDSVEGVQCVAIATEWARVRSMDEQQWRAVYARMRRPAYVLDGRGIVDVNLLQSIGFRVYQVGKAPSEHVELV